MMFSKDVFDNNAPDTWLVVKEGPKLWHLTTKGGVVIASAMTKKATEDMRTNGFAAKLYEKERRWMAGESIPGWRPYDGVL